MDKELTKVIEDFNHAVDVEALRLAKRNGEHLLPLPGHNSFSVAPVEQEFLLTRFKRVETGYDRTLCCMQGTRETLLNQIMDWVANESDTRNVYWAHGLPGIGKTALAHSICEKLHDKRRLAGAFFCERDDANMSEIRNVLPTLISALAEMFPPFRRTVADRLRGDPNLTSKSMKESLFTDLICDLPCHPKHAIVLVIDALDECGNDRNRPVVLKALTDAASHAPWLKIIVTSRSEAEIQHFFNRLPQSSCWRYDLGTDQEAGTDLQTFARSQFAGVAERWHLSTPWPAQPIFNRVISQANGLYIFIKTLVLTLTQCKDPEVTLEAASQDSISTGLKPLYNLYSHILKERGVLSDAEFWQVIGVVLTTAPYRTLGEESIGELAGVKPNLVKKWVDDLGSLLYRDEAANGGIRVRHLSISDFFISDHSTYHVNLEDANVQLGIACLKTMVKQLRFNICKLEDSRLANADINDLPSRIKEHISDALQYSSLYWSNHLCFTPDNGNSSVWGMLKKFFEGLYGLFWIEVLSILGMVPIGAPSLRRVISWAKVSSAPYFHLQMILNGYRMPTQLVLREFRIFVVSSLPSTPRSLSALRTRTFQQDPSYLHSHHYHASSASGLLKPLRCKVGNCYHGQRQHCNGLDTLIQSRPSAVPQMDITLPVDLMIRRYVYGMSRLVLPSAIHYWVTLTV